jgi:hypothetical protein
MRWKADLPKMPRLPQVPVDSADPAPDALGPPPAPRAYREKNPSESQPVEYQAPSMLVEHRGLAVLFIAAAIAFALYSLWPPRRTVALAAPTGHGAAHRSGAAPSSGAAPTSRAPQTPGPGAAQIPIYVEAVPDTAR